MRKKLLQVRLSKQEFDLLYRLAKGFGMSMSACVRWLALKEQERLLKEKA